MFLSTREGARKYPGTFEISAFATRININKIVYYLVHKKVQKFSVENVLVLNHQNPSARVIPEYH